MSDSKAQEQLVGSFVGLVILSMIVLGWFLIKCFELVVRVLVAHPDCRPVWIALAIFVVCLLMAAAFGHANPLWNASVGISFMALMMITKIAEIYHDQLLRNEISKELVIGQALNQPWWNPSGELAPQAA